MEQKNTMTQPKNDGLMTHIHMGIYVYVEFMISLIAMITVSFIIFSQYKIV